MESCRVLPGATTAEKTRPPPMNRVSPFFPLNAPPAVHDSLPSRRKFLDARTGGRFLHHLPQHLGRHAFAPDAAGLVDRAEHRAFGNSGGIAPDVNRGLDP